MKRLLNTLYVTSHNRYLSLDGENIVVLEKEKEVGRVPLHNLEAIVTFGYTGASPALMGACAERNIGLTFLSGNGRFIARVTGEVYGNVTLRKEQYRRSESEEESLKIARNCIAGKVYNSRWIVERAARDYPLRLDVEKLKSNQPSCTIPKRSVPVLMRLRFRDWKGEAASVYFSVFDDMILQQKDTFSFHGWNKRPPRDGSKCNAVFCLYPVNVYVCQRTGDSRA
ncbi:MAG: CRISPR-associated endonuclease Cas1 [Eisenbergiella massiliensis]